MLQVFRQSDKEFVNILEAVRLGADKISLPTNLPGNGSLCSTEASGKF